MGVPSRLKQHFKYHFNLCINSIQKAAVSHNDKLHVVWKSPTNKGKLATQLLNIDDAVTQSIRVWWNQQIQFEEILSMDVESQAFEPNLLVLSLKKEKEDMTTTLGEFRINLGEHANMAFAESILSSDIPANKFEFVKANITIQFKLIEKSNIYEVESTEPLDAASTIKDLKEEIARVSHECAELKQMYIDSQTFSKTDYWIEKLPEMELNLRQYTSKVDDLNTYLYKVLETTKITIMEDKFADLQGKMFANEEKLRRLSDIYNAFTQSTTNELSKLKDKIDKYSITDSEPLIMPTFTRSLIKSNNIIFMDKRAAPLSPHSSHSPRPASPLCIAIPPIDLSGVNNNINNVNIESRKVCDSSVTSNPASDSNFELKSRFALLDEFKTRLEKIENDTQQLWPRLALDEADLQQLHINAEELRWEREKYMENFYLFQKSQSQIAEELSKLKLQIDECNTLPRRLEQRVDILEVQNGKLKRMLAGRKLKYGDEWCDARSKSAPLLQSPCQSPSLSVSFRSPTPISPNLRQLSQLTTTPNWSPPYHWFLLDHCFLFACEREPTADLLIPSYFLIRFCSNNLDLARRREDWAVFDSLFFALHFEVKKHSKSPSHLLFWLANTCFILDQLNSNIFASFNSRDQAVSESAHKIIKDLEGFIKTIYLSFAGFVSNEFENAIKNFPLCNIGDFENEWVTTIIAKLEWVHALLSAYKFQDSFMQNVFGDIYGILDSTLFNLLCSESYLCTPARANQVKYFVSTLDNWACSERPMYSKIIDKLCHVRETANLILAPKANLKDSAFRHCLFPNLSDLQVKHLLTIFLADTTAERLPDNLLSHLTQQISCTPTPNDELDHQAIPTTYEFGTFFEESLREPESGPIAVRFSPPPIGDTCAHVGFTKIVNSTMQEIEEVLNYDAFTHWRYLSQELEKWEKPQQQDPRPRAGSKDNVLNVSGFKGLALDEDDSANVALYRKYRYMVPDLGNGIPKN